MPMKHSPSGNHIRDAAAQELENTDPETLSSWILTQQHLRAPEAKGNLTQLLTAIAVGCKFVASAVRKVWRQQLRSLLAALTPEAQWRPRAVALLNA